MKANLLDEIQNNINKYTNNNLKYFVLRTQCYRKYPNLVRTKK